MGDEPKDVQQVPRPGRQVERTKLGEGLRAAPGHIGALAGARAEALPGADTPRAGEW